LNIFQSIAYFFYNGCNISGKNKNREPMQNKQFILMCFWYVFIFYNTIMRLMFTRLKISFAYAIAIKAKRENLGSPLFLY